MKPTKSKQPLRPTHVDAKGRAHMVDVGKKAETLREATATAAVRMSLATLKLVESGEVKKGDVLQVARIAGLMAVKRTPDLIPLCHPLRIVGSKVELVIDHKLPGIRISVTVRAHDRTGVEMEALTAAAVTALTVYDMTKALERGIEILAVALQEKSGGKSGLWRRS